MYPGKSYINSNKVKLYLFVLFYIYLYIFFPMLKNEEKKIKDLMSNIKFINNVIGISGYDEKIQRINGENSIRRRITRRSE